MKASQHLCSTDSTPHDGLNAISFRLEWAGEDKVCAALVIETLVDEPIANFNIVATDLYQLALSTQGDGEYQIINCWCGLPECARLPGGIHVHHPDNLVQWEFTLSSMSRGERPAAQRYTFRKEHYVEAVMRFAKEMAAEQERQNAGGGRGKGIVLYSEHRYIREGGIEKALGLKRMKEVG